VQKKCHRLQVSSSPVLRPSPGKARLLASTRYQRGPPQTQGGKKKRWGAIRDLGGKAFHPRSLKQTPTLTKNKFSLPLPEETLSAGPLFTGERKRSQQASRGQLRGHRRGGRERSAKLPSAFRSGRGLPLAGHRRWRQGQRARAPPQRDGTGPSVLPLGWQRPEPTGSFRAEPGGDGEAGTVRHPPRKGPAGPGYLGTEAPGGSVWGEGGSCPPRRCDSSSAAFCSATSTSSWKPLKSSPESSGGVGGGVLKSPLVGLPASARASRVAVLPAAPSGTLGAGSGSARRGPGGFSRSGLRALSTVRLLPSAWAGWHSTCGHTDIDSTLAAVTGGTTSTPEPAADPRGRATSPALPPRREMVNWLGSFPSLRSMSGSSRLRALMNQLQIWEERGVQRCQPGAGGAGSPKPAEAPPDAAGLPLHPHTSIPGGSGEAELLPARAAQPPTETPAQHRLPGSPFLPARCRGGVARSGPSASPSIAGRRRSRRPGTPVLWGPPARCGGLGSRVPASGSAATRGLQRGWEAESRAVRNGRSLPARLPGQQQVPERGHRPAGNGLCCGGDAVVGTDPPQSDDSVGPSRGVFYKKEKSRMLRSRGVAQLRGQARPCRVLPVSPVTVSPPSPCHVLQRELNAGRSGEGGHWQDSGGLLGAARGCGVGWAFCWESGPRSHPFSRRSASRTSAWQDW